MYNTSKEYAGFCSGFRGSSYLWLGANDIAKEGIWSYTESGEPISWDGPWRGDGPNGGTEENCLVMLTGDFPGRWSDIACLESYYFCAPCEFNGHVSLYLKGPALCKTSPFNHEYFIEGLRNDKPLIAGTLHSEIYWERNTSSWVLTSLKVG